MKNIIMVVLMLSLISVVSADVGFSDFLPADPIQSMTDAGIWDEVLFVIAILTALVITAVVGGLLLGVGKTAVHTAGNNSQGRTDSITGMFMIIGAVLVMVILGGVFFSIWNGL